MTHGPPCTTRRPTRDGPSGPPSGGRPRPDPQVRGGATPAPEETDVHCTRCGHNNPEGSRFCAQCGAALSQERIG
ncbi:MAG TPA: zinc-ribbon domain-containing protein, partial [Geodermatophilus sp.]|nr:zinc-ribbon domain-containing protein [Geodermatophilus sp.]